MSQDDKSNFTVDNWRNKVFTDARVRSKLKDKNYRIKIIQDIELTKSGVLKLLQKNHLKSIDSVISVGCDSVIFRGTISEEYGSIHEKGKYESPVAIKVWNRPAKQLIDSKKPSYQHDTAFLDTLSSSNPNDFQNIWAEREFGFYEKLQKAGIRCPKPISYHKNLVLIDVEDSETLEDCAESSKQYLLDLFKIYLTTMRDLYEKLGLVHLNLTETSISSTGVLFDVGQVISKSAPASQNILYTGCQNICSFFRKHGLHENERLKKTLTTPEGMFAKITGFEYSPQKIATTKLENPQESVRKLERKSERSAAVKQKT